DRMFENCGKDYGKYWKILNEIAGRKKRETITSLSINGQDVNDSTEIASAFSDFFGKVVGHSELELLDERNSCPPSLGVSFTRVTADEIVRAISKISAGGGSLSNGISGKVLKKLAPCLVEPLVELLNRSFEEGFTLCT
ncbi:unnamed protein product, partial [Allacma fusca]